MRLSVFAASVSLLAVSYVLNGCRSLPPSKPSSQWTVEESRGAQVFRNDCARCHRPSTTSSLKGPGLQAITKVKSLPSGAPPTNERLTQTILHGRNMMPATPLTNQQLSDLLAYLHTL